MANPLGFLDGEKDDDVVVPTIELHIEGYKLMSADVTSKSDPFAVLYTRDNERASWDEIGRTETIMNNYNPKFVKGFSLLYIFEKLQEIRVEFFDRDSSSEKLTNHDYLGSAETTLAQIATSPGQSLVLSLTNEFKKKKNAGFVKFVSEQVTAKQKKIFIDFGIKLIKKDTKQRFITISKAREDGTWQAVYKSEMARLLDGSGRFKSVSTTGQALSGGDDNRPLKIEVFEEKAGSSEKPVAELQTSFAAMKRIKPGGELELLGSSDGGGKKGGLFAMCMPTGAGVGGSAGSIVVYNCKEVKKPTFLDYLLGGCRLSMVLAVDFTASNGDPRKKGTLHYCMEADVQNEYETAIRSVGGIILQYVANQEVPVYGFGARLPPNWDTSHCFPITLDPAQPHCSGIEGILQMYKQTLQKVQLYGPTNFADIIRTAASFAGGLVTQEDQKYVIMLILTDGDISDMKESIIEIINASNLPFSIIIVGVGPEQFASMSVLDADDRLLKAGGKVAARDIVQFVPYRQFNNDPIMLAKEVLAEIPEQLLHYFKSRKIRPNDPVHNEEDIEKFTSKLEQYSEDDDGPVKS